MWFCCCTAILPCTPCSPSSDTPRSWIVDFPGITGEYDNGICIDTGEEGCVDSPAENPDCCAYHQLWCTGCGGFYVNGPNSPVPPTTSRIKCDCLAMVGVDALVSQVTACYYQGPFYQSCGIVGPPAVACCSSAIVYLTLSLDGGLHLVVNLTINIAAALATYYGIFLNDRDCTIQRTLDLVSGWSQCSAPATLTITPN